LAQVIDFLRRGFAIIGVGVGAGGLIAIAVAEGVGVGVGVGVGAGRSKGDTIGIDPDASCCNLIFSNGDE